ncbi:pilus assembly protein [Streptomyces sp. WAC07061]|uniref:TadE/TadG family type IV pilus assembly protein n=1 Tax=Streptomyces sp. WAC07061 TaxID=2487410 RepID=UPI000F788E22|nr:TadE/TadG family type IV pilus assembly protein [Streptomyces sp. WAC07061]RSS49982.1 pilus assembly protein [Streptomyces sp. WAC07061]
MPRHCDQRPGRTSRLGPGLALGGPPAPGAGGPAARAGRRDDRGQVALEYIGFVPILLFVALCGIQLGWIAYVHEQADTAARTAARVEARTGSGGAAAGQAAVRGGLTAQVAISKSADAVTATVTIPVNTIVPGLSVEPARATAVMPNDDPKGP